VKLRHKFGKVLIGFGFKVYGEMPQTISVSDTKTILGKSKDAVVEVDDRPNQWSPEQHGNVVTAEPKLMSMHRRGKF
jgi:hypothetical protein